MIEFSSISKSYNPGLFQKKVQAVSALSFRVKEGEVFGLIGPNGAGKSTTIRMLLGLMRPDSGAISFRGKPLSEKSIQCEAGYLPENPYLYDHLTLLELLHFCGRTSSLDNEQIRRRGEELMARLHLLDAQSRPLRTFSKGMLQRAGVCFALLHDPAVVILDEPMSGLDPLGRSLVFDLVMELKRQGKTVFFCSHILNDVERLCDRICLMNKGRLVRELNENDFKRNSQNEVFLQVQSLTAEQKEILQKLNVSMRMDTGWVLLAVPVERYHLVSKCLADSSIDVLGARAEWFSLEELFLNLVGEEGR